MVRRLRTIEMKLHKMAEEFPNPIARESMEVIKEILFLLLQQNG